MRPRHALSMLLLVAPAMSVAQDAVFGDGFESPLQSLVLPPGTSWQWQLSGPLDTAVDVQMIDIDLVETAADTIVALTQAGRRVVCYFSAGSWEEFRPDADDFPPAVLGSPLDPPFQDERWLDIRRIDLLAPILRARLDLAVTKGCFGVEPDNMDGYANTSGFPLTPQHQLDFNRWIAAEAHARGLSVGLKNDLDQVPDLVDHFDWALNEQCFEYEECDLLLPFVAAGKAVFGVEYALPPAQFCAAANAMDFDWLKKNIELDAARISCR